MQNEKLVLYASSVWNDYKRIYAPTEKKLELLSLDYTNSVTTIMEDRDRSQTTQSDQQQTSEQSAKKI